MEHTSEYDVYDSKTKLHSAYGLGEDWNLRWIANKKATLRCTQPTGWVRIGTAVQENTAATKELLHSAYGLGEDWNFSEPFEH